MALSKSEIEILIKARNEAQGAFDSLSKQVSNVTGGASRASSEMEKVGQRTKEAGNSGQAASVAFGLLAERLARGLVGAFGETIKAANKLDSGLIGLKSVATAFGNDAGAAQEAARKLASDGLMGVGDAATSLKNLLAAGFGLPEAVELMNRFKDSAAFGRQGSLDFGEAIRGATEGIKNGNSILVDNAGVTKNLSMMLTEAGYSAQDLSKASSDVNIRMAIYNGILKETNPQLGDANRYLETAAGKQAAFNAQVEIAQQKIGKALQPALASTLNTLQPLVQIIGNNAEAFTALGAIIATLVLPKALSLASASLGLQGSLTGLASTTKTVLSAFGGVRSLGDFRAGLQLAGEAAGLTTASLGKLGTAVSIASAAFIGWEIGKIIDQFTGLSGVVERATVRIMGWSDTAAVAGAKQDVINRAIASGAAATISYTDAIKFNNDVQAVRAATFDKSAAAQLRAIDAELALGRISLETANARRGAIEAEKQAQDVQGRRLKLSDAITNAEKAYQTELKATGYSQAELVKILKDNEQGFDAWAKQVNLSDATIKRLKDSLKDSEEQTKKHTKAQEDAEKQAQKLGEALDKLGIVTADTGKKALKELLEPLDLLAKVSGPALDAALIALLPELEELGKKAERSGVQIDGLAAAQDRAKAASDRMVAPMIAWENSLPQIPLDQIIQSTQTWTAEQELAGTQARITADAFKFFGISTRDELAKTAAEARRSYELIVAAVGKNAPEAKKAYQDMIDAQKAASRELPNVWQGEIFPKMKDVLTHLGDATNGAFAQMLLGAKGFKDGFVDIWNSIKSAVGNILNSILSVFLNTFLKGIMGAMSGQKGAFGASFASMFSGGKGGGFDLGSLFGGAGGAGGGLPGASGSLIGPELGTGDMLKVGGGGTNWGGILGGAGMAAGGVMSFLQARKSQSKLGQTLGGAMTGAGIGTMIMPGIGTAIGAGVGALGGFIGSLFGASKEKKENRAADEELKAIQAELLKTYGSLEKIKSLGPAGAEVAAAWGSKGTAGLAHFQDMVKGLHTQLEKTQKLEGDLAAAQGRQAELMSWESVNQTAQKYGLTLETLGPKMQQIATTDAATALINDFEQLKAAGADVGGVLVGMKDELSKIVQESIRYGTELPQNMEPVIQELIRTGQLLDENGKAYTDISQIKFGEPVVSETEQIATSIDSLTEALKALITSMGGIAPAAGQAAGGVQESFRGVRIKIPVEYDVEDFPGLPSPEVPGAAGGVMTGQPNLVLFGEGGETELGGPKSFFRDVFASLGLDLGAGGGPRGGGSDQAPITIGPFNITAMSSSDLKGAIERDVIPPILDALRVNRRGSLTDMKSILGVA